MNESKTIPILNWHHKYNKSWKGILVPDAFRHPAKISFALAEAIYQYAFEQGWLQEGSKIIDPFGGVAGTAFHAMQRGCHWHGVELEQKFVDLAMGYDCNGTVESHIQVDQHAAGWYMVLGEAELIDSEYEWFADEQTARAALVAEGQEVIDKYTVMYFEAFETQEQVIDRPARCGLQESHDPHHIEGNIESWNRRFGKSLPHWGTAIELQGDSRKLREVLQAYFDATVNSPPYISTPISAGNVGNRMMKEAWGKGGNLNVHEVGYEQKNPDNLGSMPEGEFDLSVNSPPYASIAAGAGGLNHLPAKDETQQSGRANGTSQDTDQQYGTSEGQLARLKDEGFDLSINSPPYAEARIGTDSKQEQIGHNEAYGSTQGQLGGMKDDGFSMAASSPPFGETGAPKAKEDDPTISVKGREYARNHYGTSDGQLGQMQQESDTFWSAAKQIVQQTYDALRPDGHAFWIVKAFVRNKQIVDFPAQWQQLCESVGFETITLIRAWQVEDNGTQLAMDGNHKHHIKSRKSFFRRLAEKNNPTGKIDYEVVIVQVKPKKEEQGNGDIQ